jgi:glycerophosphoryl diester phosphodiesterase
VTCRTTTVAVVVGVAVVVLAACTGDDDTGPTTAAPTTSAPVTTTGPTTTAAPTTTAPRRPATIDELLALGRPVVLAHTGGEDEFPGSTQYAFGESAAAGVDVLDLNVELTADGVVIVQHDETVDRTTNGTGAVAAMDLATIQALDNAHWFTAACTCRDQPEEAYVFRGVRTGERPPPSGYTPDDFAIPTLREVVARHPDALLNVEIEGEGERGIAVATAAVAELTELGRLDATVLSAFDDTVVAALVLLAPDVEVSPGIGASAAWVLTQLPLPTGRILQLPPVYNGIPVLTPDVIARSHAAGYVVWVWPNDRALEDQQSYVDFLQQGLDGINVNVPTAGVAALEEFLGAE